MLFLYTNRLVSTDVWDVSIRALCQGKVKATPSVYMVSDELQKVPNSEFQTKYSGQLNKFRNK
jgi:hypothetical protein